jgi:hypothetical protein
LPIFAFTSLLQQFVSTRIVHDETLDFNLHTLPLLDQFTGWFTYSILGLEKESDFHVGAFIHHDSPVGISDLGLPFLTLDSRNVQIKLASRHNTFVKTSLVFYTFLCLTFPSVQASQVPTPHFFSFVPIASDVALVAS